MSSATPRLLAVGRLLGALIVPAFFYSCQNPSAILASNSKESTLQSANELLREAYNAEFFEKNDPKAFRLASAAADLGSVDAMLCAARILQRSSSFSDHLTRAFEYDKKAADAGSTDGLFWVAEAYFNGKGVPQNYAKALEGYNIFLTRLNGDKDKANRLTIALAESHIGDAYFNGWGVKQNMDVALKWHLQSAMHGLHIAQFLVGEYYEKGIATPADKVKAYAWYSVAATTAQEPKREYSAAIARLWSQLDGIERARAQEIAAQLFQSTKNE